VKQLIGIQASSFKQACAAAEELGLPRPNGSLAADVVVRYVARVSHARFRPSRVIFVEPRCETTIVDRIMSDDARTTLAARARRYGVKVEQVTVAS
jgi:hypothetical protein